MRSIGPLHVLKYSLTLEGLTIHYRHFQGLTILQFDPFATYALLKTAKLLKAPAEDLLCQSTQDWTPVEKLPQTQQRWCQFVQQFSFTKEVAERLALWHYEQKSSYQVTKPKKGLISPPSHNRYHFFAHINQKQSIIRNYYYERIS